MDSICSRRSVLIRSVHSAQYRAPRMIDSSSVYASSPVRDLFVQELAALAPILAGVYGNFGLFLRAHTGAPATLPKHLLGTVIDLALGDAQHFNGRLSCGVDELPLASESCKLVVAQH